MAFGTALRNAREAKGLSTSEVAAATRMKVQIVEDLEREEFGRIAAVIYGKGFIKLYAEQVGLDPKPLIAEYAAMAAPNAGLTPVPVEEPPPPRPAQRPSASRPRPQPGGAASDTTPATAQDAPPRKPPEPEPDLFSMPRPPVRAKAVESSRQAPPQESRIRIHRTPHGLRALKTLIVSLYAGTRNRARRALHKAADRLATGRAACLARIETIRFGEEPLRTIAVIIGVAVLVLFVFSSLSRCLRTPAPNEAYPIATDIPEPYFE